jgi:predicted dehydrogenase
VDIGIIGMGARSVAYARILHKHEDKDVSLRAICDKDAEVLDEYCEKYLNSDSELLKYSDHCQLLENKDIDSVLICTPDWTHKEIVIDAIKSGKNIFLEKPIATTVDDCIEIYKADFENEKVFMLGFELRNSMIFKKIKELVSAGHIGDIMSIEAKEMLSYIHAGSFFRRWHRFSKNNGGMLNAKCSHDLDLLSWIIDSDPAFVSAFADRSFFVPDPKAAMSCDKCSKKRICIYDYDKQKYADHKRIRGNNWCVFNCEKDIFDHEVVIIKYQNKVTASFTLSMVSSEANRTLVCFGTKATLKADVMRSVIEVDFIEPKNTERYKFDLSSDVHLGGDREIMDEFVFRVKNGSGGYKKDRNKNNCRAGVISSGIALAAEISIKAKSTIDMKELMKNVYDCERI